MRYHMYMKIKLTIITWKFIIFVTFVEMLAMSYVHLQIAQSWHNPHLCIIKNLLLIALVSLTC